jgi:hypothetical protein
MQPSNSCKMTSEQCKIGSAVPNSGSFAMSPNIVLNERSNLHCSCEAVTHLSYWWQGTIVILCLQHNSACARNVIQQTECLIFFIRVGKGLLYLLFHTDNTEPLMTIRRSSLMSYQVVVG